MTLSPTDYRTWRTEAQGRDLAYAQGYRAGLDDGRRHRDRLVALGVIAALLLFGRRLHPVAGLGVALAVVVALWPILFLAAAIEMTVRHHRRHRHWPRTLAYGLSWLLGLGLVVLAVASVSVWPLLGLGLLVLTWTAAPPLVRFARHQRGRGRGPGTGSGSGSCGSVDPAWPPPLAPFTDADCTLPARTSRHP